MLSVSLKNAINLTRQLMKARNLVNLTNGNLETSARNVLVPGETNDFLSLLGGRLRGAASHTLSFVVHSTVKSEYFTWP